MDHNEKRIRKRIDFDYSVLCFHMQDSEGNDNPSFVTKVKVVDISYSGVGIESPAKFNVGDSLKINIMFRSSNLLEYTGVVRWCALDKGNYKSGLEFTELTRDHIYLLNDIIKANGRKRFI